VTSQEDLDRLDADVLAHLASDWPQIVEWVKRLAERADAPAPGSALDLDDQAVPGMWVSHIARMSLGTGSQNLMSSVRHLRQFGPTVHSMQSMLRTAIWGGAQAVWLLSPTVRDDRLERASRIWFYSQDNYRKWLNTFDEDNPTTTNVNQLRQAKAHTSELLARLGLVDWSLRSRARGGRARDVRPSRRAGSRADVADPWRDRALASLGDSNARRRRRGTCRCAGTSHEECPWPRGRARRRAQLCVLVPEEGMGAARCG
jgi:hypothetical protein